MGKGAKTTQEQTSQDNRINNELAESASQLNLESANSVSVSYADENAVNKLVETVKETYSFLGEVLTGAKDTTEKAMDSLTDNKNDETQKTILILSGLALVGFLGKRFIK